eukprot:359151-Chlamydomonas_euryale.AAC.4
MIEGARRPSVQVHVRHVRRHPDVLGRVARGVAAVGAGDVCDARCRLGAVGGAVAAQRVGLGAALARLAAACGRPANADPVPAVDAAVGAVGRGAALVVRCVAAAVHVDDLADGGRAAVGRRGSSRAAVTAGAC